jgi:hypothetical protein
MRSAEDAESVVRKYFLGTRTSHGKIVSISAEEKTEGPDDSGAWKVKGAYLTEAGVRAHFAANVSSRGSTDNQLKFKQTEDAAEEAQH